MIFLSSFLALKEVSKRFRSIFMLPIIFLIMCLNQTLASSIKHDFIFKYGSLQLFMILICLIFSSYLTGLNIGLLSFDKFGLLLMIYNGTARERYYASILLPYLEKKHQSLVTILIIKTFCESVFTLLLDNLIIQVAPPAISLLITAISSALILLIFGEIMPQSLFLKYSLEISAVTHHVIDCLWLVMLPIAYPLALILDAILGKEKPKSSNQIFMLQEILRRVLSEANQMHCAIILQALGIDDASYLEFFVDEDFIEIYSDFNNNNDNNDNNNNGRMQFMPNEMSRKSMKIFYKIPWQSMKSFKFENILKIECNNADLTFAQENENINTKIAQTSPISCCFSNSTSSNISLAQNQNNLDNNNDNNNNNDDNLYDDSKNQNLMLSSNQQSLPFFVLKKSSRISKVLHKMQKKQIEICLICGVKKSTKKSAILGYISRQNLIDSIVKMVDNHDEKMCQEGESIKKDDNSSTSQFSFEDSNISKPFISPSITYPRKQSRISKYFDKIVTELCNSHYLLSDKKEKLLQILSYSPQNLNICSLNSDGFSHQNFVLNSSIPTNFLIFTLHGYLPVKMSNYLLSLSKSNNIFDDEKNEKIDNNFDYYFNDYLNNNNNNNIDNIENNKNKITNNNDIIVYISPFTLIGDELLEKVKNFAENRIKNNDDNDEKNINSPKVEINDYNNKPYDLYYIPSISMTLPKSSHYATYLALDMNQLMQLYQ